MFRENNDKHSYSPNDPLYQRQWNSKTLGTSEIWSWQESLSIPTDMSFSGKNITVAMISTEVWRPRERSQNIKEGLSFVPSEKTLGSKWSMELMFAGTIAQGLQITILELQVLLQIVPLF